MSYMDIPFFTSGQGNFYSFSLSDVKYTGVCCLYEVIVFVPISCVLLAKESLTCFDTWQATQVELRTINANFFIYLSGNIEYWENIGGDEFV